jgi:hypothetical protein
METTLNLPHIHSLVFYVFFSNILCDFYLLFTTLVTYSKQYFFLLFIWLRLLHLDHHIFVSFIYLAIDYHT